MSLSETTRTCVLDCPKADKDSLLRVNGGQGVSSSGQSV